jgi:hypothetical protein
MQSHPSTASKYTQKGIIVSARPTDVVRIMDICTSRKVFDRYTFAISFDHRVPDEFIADKTLVQKTRSALLLFLYEKWERFKEHQKERENIEDTYIRSFIGRWFNLYKVFMAVIGEIDLDLVISLSNDANDEAICSFCGYAPRERTNSLSLEFGYGRMIASPGHVPPKGIIPLFSTSLHSMGYDVSQLPILAMNISPSMFVALRCFWKFLICISNGIPVPVQYIATCDSSGVILRLPLLIMNGLAPLPEINMVWGPKFMEEVMSLEIKHTGDISIPAQVRKFMGVGFVVQNGNFGREFVKVDAVQL